MGWFNNLLLLPLVNRIWIVSYGNAFGLYEENSVWGKEKGFVWHATIAHGIFLVWQPYDTNTHVYCADEASLLRTFFLLHGKWKKAILKWHDSRRDKFQWWWHLIASIKEKEIDTRRKNSRQYIKCITNKLVNRTKRAMFPFGCSDKPHGKCHSQADIRRFLWIWSPFIQFLWLKMWNFTCGWLDRWMEDEKSIYYGGKRGAWKSLIHSPKNNV